MGVVSAAAHHVGLMWHADTGDTSGLWLMFAASVMGVAALWTAQKHPRI
jgi:hypothetical protein